MSDSTDLPEVLVTTRPKDKTAEKTRKLPPYNVIIDNDDLHSFEFVIDTLRKALCVTEQQAIQFTQLAHRTGRAIVWTGNKEVAELKMEQIQSFHEIRADGAKLEALGVSIEPAAG